MSAFPTLGGAAPQQAMPVMPIPQQMPVMSQATQITLEAVTAMGAVEAQKQFLGEHLFPRVQAMDAERAGRIVGMILDAYTVEQMIDLCPDPDCKGCKLVYM